MAQKQPGERTPGKKVGPETARIGGIASAKARAANKLTGKKVWTREETLEHIEYAHAALAQPISEQRIIRTMLHQFNQVRVGPDGNARNPITRLRARRIIRRVLDDWGGTYSSELKHQQMRAVERAYDMLDMARNGRVRTVGEGEQARVFVTKPSIHGYVQAADHLARLQGTYAPEKNAIHLTGDLARGGVDQVIFEMSDAEKRRSIAAAKERFPHLFKDQVREHQPGH